MFLKNDVKSLMGAERPGGQVLLVDASKSTSEWRLSSVVYFGPEKAI